MTPLVEITHPAGYAIGVPEGWECAADPRPEISLVSVEPDRGGAFRANVVVTIDHVPAEVTGEQWHANTGRLLQALLGDFILLDEQPVTLAGRPAVRRLAHHHVPDSGAVTLEAWALLDLGRGFTVTTSVATFEYDSRADLLADIAGGFRPPGASA